MHDIKKKQCLIQLIQEIPRIQVKILFSAVESVGTALCSSIQNLSNKSETKSSV